MKLLKMYNLCVDELASVRFPAYSPQAIVKPKPLARSVANINLSARAYQYPITVQVSLPRAFKYCSLWDWPSKRPFKHICTLEKWSVIKSIICSIFWQFLLVKAIRLLLACLSSGGLEAFGCFWLQDTGIFVCQSVSYCIKKLSCLSV